MCTRDLPRRLIRATMILIAVWCVAALTPVRAQQASDSARVVPADTARVSSPSTPAPGPSLAPRFERVGVSVAPRNASVASPLPVAGGSHTIVISTLSLVLIVVLVVLLVR
jgi:hypothetical protein